MQKRKNRFLLFSSLGLGLFILIIILGYFLTQSTFFLNFVRKTMISQVNKQINGSIDIASIEGNIFRSLTLQDIVLSDENSGLNKAEVVHLKEIKLSYDLGKLLHKKLLINSISVEGLQINLHQDHQGTWNLVNIPLKKEASNVDSSKTEKSSSSWGIELTRLSLLNLRVNISGDNLAEQIPREIFISQIISQASLGEELEWKVSKIDLEVQPQNLTLSLRDLQGNDKLDIRLKQLEISSPQSQIKLTGDMVNEAERLANISFQAKPLDFAEIQTWFPSFPLQGAPSLSGEVVLHGNSLSSELLMTLAEQKIELTAQLANFQNPLNGQFELAWENINSNLWKDNLPESRLNGNLFATIQGETWPEVDADLTLKLQDSSFNSYKIYTFFLNSKGSPDLLKNDFQLRSEFGEINAKADLDSLLGDIGYAVSASIKDFNLLKIVPSFPYQSEINSQLSLRGKGIDPKTLNLDLDISFAGSSLENKVFEKLNLRGNYQQGDYLLKDMLVNYDGLALSAQGKGNIYENNELTYNLHFDYLPQIVQEFQADFALKGRISGRASGTVNDLTANTKIDLQDLNFQAYKLASLTGNSEVKLKDNKPEIAFLGWLNKIDLPTLPIESTWIDAHYAEDKLSLDLNLIQSDSLDISISGDIFPVQQLANFTKLELNALGQNWYNRPDTLKVSFAPDKLSLQNLELVSDSQSIIANLLLDSLKTYELGLKFDSLALWPLSLLNPELATIKGKLSLDIAGKGQLNNPQLSAIWSLDKFSLKDIGVDKIAGNLNYQDKLAQLDLEINRAKDESISLKGYLPVQADISNNDFKILKDQPLNFELKMTPFDLTNLNAYTDDVKEIKGNLDFSAQIRNTMNQPQLDAKLLIAGLAFKLPTLGIDYRKINLDFEIHNNRLELKKLTLPSGKKGFVTMKGSTLLNLKDSQLDSLKFSLDAKNWQVMKNNDMDLKIDSKLEIAGDSNYPTFSGYLNVQRASLYLPALLGGEKKKVPLTIPLLLANSSDNNKTETTEPIVTKKPSQTMKNLRGNLKLSFPHNTWIKSKEMNLELGGELEIIKDSPDFALSGNVMVVRGNYTIYGRRFNISSGNIYFQGERDLNPEISITANYIMRSSSQEKITLAIQVTGRLQEPVIQFLLDDKAISEGDGVSYIVFGKSTAELSSGEKGQIDSSGDDNLATKILVSQIASRVTSVLQNRLNLDVVEFKGDNNWRQAQVVVGKYLTNNLFLSYERELSFGSDNEVVPDTITLEYELKPRLYLQGTQGGDNSTGVDLIWKFKK